MTGGESRIRPNREQDEQKKKKKKKKKKEKEEETTDTHTQAKHKQEVVQLIGGGERKREQQLKWSKASGRREPGPETQVSEVNIQTR